MLCFLSSCSSALRVRAGFVLGEGCCLPLSHPKPTRTWGRYRSWGAPPGCPLAAALEFHHGQCTAAWEKWATAWPGEHTAQRNWLLWSRDLPLQQAACRELQAALGAQGPLLREHPPCPDLGRSSPMVQPNSPRGAGLGSSDPWPHLPRCSGEVLGQEVSDPSGTQGLPHPRVGGFPWCPVDKCKES